MSKPKLGTKRTCPETGKNFYDLNKDPIVSPYTQKEYPLSFFEATAAKPEKASRKAEK
ncbi:MAG: TIGR02300 family protein, partial [Pseudomonadota bacterium]